MDSAIFELTVIILLAATLGIVLKIFKQPTVLAYLITGAVIGYFGFFNLNDKDFFTIFSDLGIMFLLFLVGLEIDYSSLRLVGKASLIIGLSQVVFTSIIGFGLAILFGFNNFQSAYIAVALTFSSTIIVIKLLSEKKDLNSLYGKIAIGLLLVQDFLAILILIFLSGMESGSGLGLKDIILTVIKGIVLFFFVFFIGRRFIPIIFDKISRSQELLFLSSLAWVLIAAFIVEKIGFSLEIGGFLAGLALANSSEHFQIASRIKPLRDFFVLIFFAILGSSMIFSTFDGLILPIIAFSIFVLIGNPLIVLIIMGILGYKKRTGFLTGITIAQISEFSLVLAALGFKIGHLSENAVTLITAVGVITIIASTYMTIYSNKIFRIISPYLSIFERRKAKENGFPSTGFNKPIILIGSHRTGQSIAFNLPKEDLLIIDFDPEIISQLKKHDYDYIFGDINDSEVFEKANLKNARLVISTSPDLEDNLMILAELKKEQKRPKIVLRARTEKEADILYNPPGGGGADYILLPHFTAGQYLGKTIAIDPEMNILNQLREKDLSLMRIVNHQV
ncbi:MAG: cation:proton antiporter [Patescibacteria group bacterium]